MQKQQDELSSEIAKVLTGDSVFAPEMLGEAINKNKADIAQKKETLIEVKYTLDNQNGAMKKLDYYYYDQFQSWADEYVFASKEQKKMIVCQLVKKIRVSRGYEIDILLDVNYQQFLDESIEAVAV